MVSDNRGFKTTCVGKEVIMCCKASVYSSMPFDTASSPIASRNVKVKGNKNKYKHKRNRSLYARKYYSHEVSEEYGNAL